MKKQILFLDIDGVLNRSSTRERCNGFLGVDRELAKKLLDWMRGKPIGIVLSSSWRNQLSMHPHLKEAGIRWIGKTPRLPGVMRGIEIRAWVEKNGGVEKYAILDDNSDMLPEQLPRFVQTETYAGLQDDHIKKLTELFRQ